MDLFATPATSLITITTWLFMFGFIPSIIIAFILTANRCGGAATVNGVIEKHPNGTQTIEFTYNNQKYVLQDQKPKKNDFHKRTVKIVLRSTTKITRDNVTVVRGSKFKPLKITLFLWACILIFSILLLIPLYFLYGL